MKHEINIAILAASRQVELVKRFRKFLHHNGGGKVHALDIEKNKPSLFFADDYAICPKTDDKIYTKFLLQYCVENNICLLFSCREEDLYTLAKLKKRFEAIGCFIMVSDVESIRICNNKKEFTEFCIKNNFEVPKTYTLGENIEYPVFVKPVVGKGSKNNFIVKNEHFLQAILEHYDQDFIVQELIKEKEYTIDLFSDFSGEVISVVPRERIAIVAGESYVGRTIKDKNLINSCVKIAKALKLIGHSTIQCFYDGVKVKFIEINPRFGGAANLGFASGPSTPEYLIRLAMGEKIESQIGNFKDKLLMLRYTRDLFLGNAEEKNKIFCIDIDGTICTEGERYELAKPINKVIDKINQLYVHNKIILFTARGSSSGTDWSNLTRKQLKDWNVKYHELNLKKPFADYYIDNKAVDVLEWI